MKTTPRSGREFLREHDCPAQARAADAIRRSRPTDYFRRRRRRLWARFRAVFHGRQIQRNVALRLPWRGRPGSLRVGSPEMERSRAMKAGCRTLSGANPILHPSKSKTIKGVEGDCGVSSRPDTEARVPHSPQQLAAYFLQHSRRPFPYENASWLLQRVGCRQARLRVLPDLRFWGSINLCGSVCADGSRCWV